MVDSLIAIAKRVSVVFPGFSPKFQHLDLSAASFSEQQMNSVADQLEMEALEQMEGEGR